MSGLQPSYRCYGKVTCTGAKLQAVRPNYRLFDKITGVMAKLHAQEPSYRLYGQITDCLTKLQVLWQSYMHRSQVTGVMAKLHAQEPSYRCYGKVTCTGAKLQAVRPSYRNGCQQVAPVAAPTSCRRLAAVTLSVFSSSRSACEALVHLNSPTDPLASLASSAFVARVRANRRPAKSALSQPCTCSHSCQSPV